MSFVRVTTCLVMLGALAGCTATSPIVSARCAPGLTYCGRCVNLLSDPDHCGACDHACNIAEQCVQGMCVARDGAVGDAELGRDGGFEGTDAGGGDRDARLADAEITVDAGGFDGGRFDAVVLDVDAGSGSRDAALRDGGGVDGAINGGRDAGAFDAGSDAASSRDGASAPGDAARDAAVRDALVFRDGSSLDAATCDLGELACGGVCVDALEDPAHCGACGRACPVGEVCASGRCTLTCDPPLVPCRGRCIDVSSDPDNCGGCGVVCESGICIDGECSAPLAGHGVVIGHDYEVGRRGINRIAGNAVFLGRGNPNRVLVWEGGSTAASRAGTDAAISQVASAIGRSWARSRAATAEEVPLLLRTANTFVIYAQETSTDDELRALGETWSRALRQFAYRGGVIVLFDTDTPNHRGTWQILAEAGLFECAGSSDATGSMIDITAPVDAVAVSVPLTYVGEQTTVRFQTTTDTVVAADALGPVVVHLSIVP